MEKNNQKYTLLLPVEIYQALVAEAEKQGRSIREILRQCLKFGLTIMEIAQDPNADLILREKVEVPDSGNPPKYEFQETKIKFIL